MKATIRSVLTPAAICAIMSMGCATTYSPRETGRIHFLTSGKGEEVMEKDGKKYSMDIFSGATAKGGAALMREEVHRDKTPPTLFSAATFLWV